MGFQNKNGKFPSSTIPNLLAKAASDVGDSGFGLPKTRNVIKQLLEDKVETRCEVSVMFGSKVLGIALKIMQNLPLYTNL